MAEPALEVTRARHRIRFILLGCNVCQLMLMMSLPWPADLTFDVAFPLPIQVGFSLLLWGGAPLTQFLPYIDLLICRSINVRNISPG